MRTTQQKLDQEVYLMQSIETKNWHPATLTFPMMMSFSDYHEIEEVRDILSILFNTRLECFELEDGEVEQEKGLGVKLFRHTGDYYVGLFQPVSHDGRYRGVQ